MRDYPHVQARTRKVWRAWLSKHHSKSPGVWLIFPKKATGLATVSYGEAVEEALCFGWIDSLMRPVDHTYYMQLFTPRKPKSAWAQSNKTRVARLIAAGLMAPAGLAAIELAKSNGGWQTLDAAESLTMPRELRTALNANARAKKHWPQFTESQRKQFLFWLASAKRPETREKRIAEIVAMTAARITPGNAYEARRRARKT